LTSQRALTVVLIVVLALLGIAAVPASAVAPELSAFQRTWDRTDRPVQEQRVNRTWMWDLAVTDVRQ
jgi:hypothetical protein